MPSKEEADRLVSKSKEAVEEAKKEVIRNLKIEAPKLRLRQDEAVYGPPAPPKTIKEREDSGFQKMASIDLSGCPSLVTIGDKTVDLPEDKAKRRKEALEWFESIKGLSLTDALALAQMEMYNPAKEGVVKRANGEDRSYAEIGAVVGMVREACNAWGIFFSQPIEVVTHRQGDMKPVEVIKTTVSKGGEERVLCAVELPRYMDAQMQGENITYFRRYSAQSAFGFAGEEDLTEYRESTETRIGMFYPAKEVPKADPAEMRRFEEAERGDVMDAIAKRRLTAMALDADVSEVDVWADREIGKGLDQMDSAEAALYLERLDWLVWQASSAIVERAEAEAIAEEAAKEAAKDKDIAY